MTDSTSVTTSLVRPGGRRWPLVVLALPAAVAIWSGWVGLGQMAGFGVVHPLPGIADSFELNTAITLPIGVEAYASLALGTWLSSRPIPAPARRFAAWSSLAALGLGLLGQIVYHLLAALGYTAAPVPVVVFVACLPVLVLGAGAALHHLLGGPSPAPEATAPESTAPDSAAPESTAATESAPERQPATGPVPAPARPAPRQRRRYRGEPPAPRRLLADYLTEARAQLDEHTEPSPAWCRQVTGCSRGTSVKLAAALRAEHHNTTARLGPPTRTTADREESVA